MYKGCPVCFDSPNHRTISEIKTLSQKSGLHIWRPCQDCSRWGSNLLDYHVDQSGMCPTDYLAIFGARKRDMSDHMGLLAQCDSDCIVSLFVFSRV